MKPHIYREDGMWFVRQHREPNVLAWAVWATTLAEAWNKYKQVEHRT